MYKPNTEYKNIAESLEMKDKKQNVIIALKDFELTFQQLLGED